LIESEIDRAIDEAVEVLTQVEPDATEPAGDGGAQRARAVQLLALVGFLVIASVLVRFFVAAVVDGRADGQGLTLD